jgi:hypothetical protein
MAKPKSVSELLDSCLGPALAAQGFAAADVVVAWPEIVGDRLARFSQPLRIDWPRGARARGRDERPEPATLVVRVEGAFAIELQHLAPVVIERVNAYYGWRCIGRLVLKQGPVRRRAAGVAPPDDPLPADAAARIAAATGGIAAEDLRDALARLGEAVARDARRQG